MVQMAGSMLEPHAAMDAAINGPFAALPRIKPAHLNRVRYQNERLHVPIFTQVYGYRRRIACPCLHKSKECRRSGIEWCGCGSSSHNN